MTTFGLADSRGLAEVIWLVLDERNPNLAAASDNAEGDRAGLPGAFRLNAPAPNPFGTGTQIGYDLSKATNVSVAVFDPSGRRVRTIAQGYQVPGHYTVPWDGRDAQDHTLRNGVYFIRMQADGLRFEQKAILLRE